jgi:hypothetical protein
MRISLLAAVAAGAAALAIGVQAFPAGAVGSPTDACALISETTLKSIIGLSNIGEVHNRPGHVYPEEADGMVHATCDGVAWSGPKPTSFKQAKEKLADGTGAEWGIDTYASDTGAPPEDLARWVGPTTVNGKPDPGGYAHVIAGLEGGSLKELVAGLNYLHALHGGPFHPPRLGAEDLGGYEARVPAKGLLSRVRAAGAYWTDESSHAIIEIGFVQGKHAAAVRKKLEKIARVAVPAFGL